MRDPLDVLTEEMFPLERAQALFEEWMKPFVDDESDISVKDGEKSCALS